jgi:hypothetical protein
MCCWSSDKGEAQWGHAGLTHDGYHSDVVARAIARRCSILLNRHDVHHGMYGRPARDFWSVDTGRCVLLHPAGVRKRKPLALPMYGLLSSANYRALASIADLQDAVSVQKAGCWFLLIVHGRRAACGSVYQKACYVFQGNDHACNAQCPHVLRRIDPLNGPMPVLPCLVTRYAVAA